MTNNNHEENIQQVFKKFADAWNVHNAHSFANLFSEDADFTNVFGLTIHGRTAIENQHDGIFKTLFKNSSLAITGSVIRFLSNDLAAADVKWTMAGATNPQGGAWPNRKGLMNLILKHATGEWKILIMHNMDLPTTPL